MYNSSMHSITTKMTGLSQMAIADMDLDQIKAELCQRYRIAMINGRPVEIEGTRKQLVQALIKAREQQAA